MATIGDRARVAITLGTTTLLGAETYVRVFHPHFLGALGSAVPWGLALVGVFVVYRWWALLPALVVPVVHGYAYNYTSHVDRWASESVTFGSPVADGLVGIAVCLVIFAIPLLLRFLWESFRSQPHERVSPGRPAP
jgi:hypothetical protein